MIAVAIAAIGCIFILVMYCLSKFEPRKDVSITTTSKLKFTKKCVSVWRKSIQNSKDKNKLPTIVRKSGKEYALWAIGSEGIACYNSDATCYYPKQEVTFTVKEVKELFEEGDFEFEALVPEIKPKEALPPDYEDYLFWKRTQESLALLELDSATNNVNSQSN